MNSKVNFLLFSSFCLTMNLFGQQERLPNVIYIMADDLGIGDLGCYGQKFIKTPAMDRLAREGILFTQHYVGCPVSGPSRCSVVTGKHTGHGNVRGNALTPVSQGELFDLPLAKDEITIAEIVKQKGYATGCVGKWGLGGPESEGSPNRQGFDYFFGFLNQASAHRHYAEFMFENNQRVMLDKKVYANDIFEEKALSFISNNSGKPFLLYFIPTIPHADLKVPNDDIGEYEGMFCEKPYLEDPSGRGFQSQAKPIGTYAAMVSRLDKSVQKILDILKEKNIDQNTIIIFTSDNGVHDRAGYNPDVMDSNGPFRGIKRDMYDGGIRTPYLVRWPEKIKPGTTSYHVSAFYDFLPTLCDLVGVKVPEGCDGISFLPTLTGNGTQKEHDFLYWEIHENGGLQAVLKDNWKLIRFNVDKKDYRYELYNLTHDPGEQRKVALQYPDKVKAMSQLLDQSHTKNPRYPFAYETEIKQQ
jgi:arylsulfatase A-like enzyme